MATVGMASVGMPGGSIQRGMVRLSPALFYCMKGVRTSDSVSETWVSRGVQDYRVGTHTGVVVLGQWYSAE